MEKRPIRLTDCFKTYTYDQDKVFTPEETVRRFKAKLDEVDLDILKEVRRIDNGRLDIPIYFSITGKDARQVIGNKKQMGKGSTPDQSQASACMELAERFSFFSFIKNPANFLVDTYANLKASGQVLMPIERLLQSVHDETTSVGVLEKLLADIPIRWTWATNLTRNQEELVPFSWFYAINEFNGPSAGNTFEEAICQGICEIVERHVCAVISHDEVRAPRINLDSAKDPVSRELIDKFTRHGIKVYLNDFSLDTGIPTVGAVAFDPSTFPATSEIVFTAGTTPDPEKALIRALTEVAQLAGDFNTKSNYVASGLPKPLAHDEIEYLTGAPTTVDLHAMPNLGDNNIKVEVERCLAALAKLGMDVYVVNTMHPKLQMSTIYTIVPGAHFRERSRSKNAGLFAAKLLAELVTSPEESNRQLRRIQKLLPDAYFIEFYLARNLLLLEDYDKALAHFQRALLLNPSDEDLPYIYSYMGNCLKDLQLYREAIDVLEKGAAMDNTRPDLHNMLGYCHFKLALSLDPAIDFARDNLHQLMALQA